MYSQEDLFSPLDGDVSLQTRFTFGSGRDGDAFESTPLSPLSQLSPLSVEVDAKYKRLRRYSIPRKSLPVYQQIRTQNDSFVTMHTDSMMEKEEQPVPVKRGWRFYGTFVALALVNLICAIDATILSVALPVRDPADVFDIILINFKDYRHRSERNVCNPSFLGWDFLPPVRSSQTASHLSGAHTIADVQRSSNLHGRRSHISSGASQLS